MRARAAAILERHDGETQALRRAIRFFTEAATDPRDEATIERLWTDLMEAPLHWSGRPAHLEVIRFLVERYVELTLSAHNDVIESTRAGGVR